MATSLDSSVQYERDLRSSHKEWKRSKDSSTKWASGTRDLPGVKKNNNWNMTGNELLTTSNGHHPNQMTKSRPAKKIRADAWSSSGCEYPKQSSRNLYKLRHHTGRSNNIGYHSINFPKLFAHKDIRYGDDQDYSTPASTTPSAHVSTTKKNLFSSITSTAAEDTFLYSFDQDATPGFSRTPLTLENFVKTDDRKTEKFVEKEYEILDANGEALKGRKAKRRGLRGGAAAASQDKDDEEVVEDEGFELV
ncbi:hypothetical protein QBC32DRAFT_38810 [Pseudoneurospora amorphoporcata]|uniref:Uncharacterized protein n=1 Tax=Pseudoneurospora amorphoporcata TaxID=241081 RepID=A0AAN6P0R7_9PEZI|nr:hypothetical protein QBC32DRAFT_38810 [Pseudoneurospora amorphoporcata]